MSSTPDVTVGKGTATVIVRPSYCAVSLGRCVASAIIVLILTAPAWAVLWRRDTSVDAMTDQETLRRVETFFHTEAGPIGLAVVCAEDDRHSHTLDLALTREGGFADEGLFGGLVYVDLRADENHVVEKVSFVRRAGGRLARLEPSTREQDDSRTWVRTIASANTLRVRFSTPDGLSETVTFAVYGLSEHLDWVTEPDGCSLEAPPPSSEDADPKDADASTWWSWRLLIPLAVAVVFMLQQLAKRT